MLRCNKRNFSALSYCNTKENLNVHEIKTHNKTGQFTDQIKHLHTTRVV